MSWNGKAVMRAVVGAALSATLALGGAMPSVALAKTGDKNGTGTLTINKSADNTVSSYKAIKIFKTNVYNDGTDESPHWVASDLEWESDAIKAAVVNAIKLEDPTYTSNDPQDAADFLIAHITGTTSTTMVAADSFASKLAKAVGTAVADNNNQLSAKYEITPNSATEVEEGYYLIIVDPTEVSQAGASGTSPILLMMGENQTLTIAEKVIVPTITKTVKEDASTVTDPNLYADAQVGQELSYKLTGTVAGNIVGYGTYKYVFTDTLSKGLDLKTSGGTASNGIDNGDVVVKVTNTDATTTPPAVTTYNVETGYTTGYDTTTDVNKHVLTVTFNDLKSATGKQEGVAGATTAVIPINSTSVVTVEYVASLNSSAVVGTTAGNPNTATLTYSNMPTTDFTGTSTSTEAKAYTYGLKLLKMDQEHELDGVSNNSVPLQGAKFTIKATSTDEAANNGKYLLATGTDAGKFGTITQPTATDTNYLFTTGADGSFSVNGLDAGTYTIHEVAPPTGYDELVSDITLEITVTKHQNTLLPESVTATVSGGERGTSGSYNAETGVITLTATNKKEEELPLTGLPGITMVYVVGGAILAVSLVTIVRRRIAEKE